MPSPRRIGTVTAVISLLLLTIQFLEDSRNIVETETSSRVPPITTTNKAQLHSWKTPKTLLDYLHGCKIISTGM
jgi:hypothetical protein